MDQMGTDLPLTEDAFREAVTQLMMFFTPQKAGISRITLFQAVSILDKFLGNLTAK